MDLIDKSKKMTRLNSESQFPVMYLLDNTSGERKSFYP